MIVQRVCAWCNMDMGPAAFETSNPRYNITHGICLDCKEKLQYGHNKKRESLQQFLNKFEKPVFLVDSQIVIKTANNAGRHMVEKPLEKIENFVGGEVFDCVHFKKNGTCGKSQHCKGCMINSSILKTLENGTGVVRKIAEIDIKNGNDIVKQKLLITTEKVKDIVFLQIDKVDVIELIEQHPD